MTRDGFLNIPKPCHEDWAGMTPAERGRHCAACDKVVRDFVGTDRVSAEAELSRGGVHCARVPAAWVAPPTIAGALVIRHMPAGLRRFLIAFLLVFGWSVWALPEAQAQALNTAIDSLRVPENLYFALGDTAADDIRLTGLVQDVYTREAVMHAEILAYDGNRLLAGTFSGENGEFALRIPRKALTGDGYTVRLRYLGRERTDREIKATARELLYLIDASEMLEGLTIASEQPRSDILTGQIVVGALFGATPISHGGLPGRVFEHGMMYPMSEVRNIGRW